MNTEVDFLDAYNFLNLPIRDEEILDAVEKLKNSNQINSYYYNVTLITTIHIVI